MLTRRHMAILSIAAPLVAAPFPSRRLMSDDDLQAYLEPMMGHRSSGAKHALAFNRDLAKHLGLPNVFPDSTMRRKRLNVRWTLEVAYDGRMPPGAEEEVRNEVLVEMTREIRSDLHEMTDFVAVVPNVVIDPNTFEPVLVFRLHYLS